MESKATVLNKVARITLYFWIMKVLSTTLGEILGDFLSMSLNLGYVIGLVITVVLFLVVLAFQLKAAKYYPPLFWLVIVSTTTLGMEISDLMDRTLGLGYIAGSLLLFVCLMLTLFLWHKQEKGIRVYPVTKRSTEAFYWTAILISNSLGTAFGDYLSDNIGLSYLAGAAITAGIIGIVMLLHYFTKLNDILLFWIAFVFTRPFGATFGDFLTKPVADGGLNFSRGIAALITAGLLVLVLLFSMKKDKELKNA
ncbi:COG4705 family protein [Mucilaginibacter boryungensis]|uniref:Membrane-anchored protein n=1 Tax=Mucilaginibacter boryungensis TaxID=768480 RepID=A0ABR9XIW4_9SPHI|nr:hypothetical protein [Mucilaginibacter boryungensis]MBE9666958.1 hypothetical protein [Mucilaginibacter boryungensis]